MKIHIKPRNFFENLKGTSQEIGVMTTYNVISINTCEYKPKNIVKEEPPFSGGSFVYKDFYTFLRTKILD